MKVDKDTKIQPLAKNVIIKIDPPETITKGGIIIPETAKTNANDTGTIDAIGEGVEGLKIGDRVLFQYVNMKVTLNEPDCKKLLIPAEFVIGIIED